MNRLPLPPRSKEEYKVFRSTGSNLMGFEKLLNEGWKIKYSVPLNTDTAEYVLMKIIYY